jgi:elongation factor 1-gamma
VPEEVTDAADYESYAFTKVNVGGKVGALEISAEDKQLWDEYLAWEGAHLPGKFADGKIFK